MERINGQKIQHPAPAAIRTFETGATRNSDTGKHDYEGFLSPHVIQEFGKYMHRHRHLEDGTLRNSDNWQHGIPLPVYASSLWRHFLDWWFLHRGIARYDDKDGHKLTMQEVCCSILFNVMGYLHETIKADK